MGVKVRVNPPNMPNHRRMQTVAVTDVVPTTTSAAFVGHGGDKLERIGGGGLANVITICICLSVCVCVCVWVVCWVRFAHGWWICSAPKSKSKSATKKQIYTKMFLLSNSRQQQRGATTTIFKLETGVVLRYQRPVGARRLLQKLPDLRERSCETCQTTRARERAFVLKYI